LLEIIKNVGFFLKKFDFIYVEYKYFVSTKLILSLFLLPAVIHHLVSLLQHPVSFNEQQH
jgi:hypothetical protein